MKLTRGWTIVEHVAMQWLMVLTIVAVVSLCAYATQSDQILYAWITNSDRLTLPFLARDLHRSLDSWTGWQLSRAPYLFPDLFFAYVTYAVTGTLAHSLSGALSLMYCLQVFVLFQLLRLTGGKFILPQLLLASGLWFLVPTCLVLANGDITEHVVKYQFSLGTHFSAVLLACLTFVLVVKVLSPPDLSNKRLSIYLIGIWALCGAALASNRIYLLYGVLPSIVLGLFAGASKHRSWKRVAAVLLVISLSGVTAKLIDLQLDRQPDLPLARTMATLGGHLRTFLLDAFSQLTTGSVPLRLWLLSCGLYIVAAPILLISRIRDLRYVQRGKLDGDRFIWTMLSIAFWIGSVMSLAGTIVGYENIESWRYLTGFFYFPLLHATVFLARLFDVTLATPQIRPFAIGIAGMILLFQVAAILAESLSANGDVKRAFNTGANNLSRCVQENGLHAGVASYWLVRRTAFFAKESPWLQPLRPWDPGGGFFYWGNNAFNFFEKPDGSPPIYDFVVQEGYSREQLHTAFGAPSGEILCEGGTTLFVYDNSEALFAKLVENNGQIFAPLLKRDGRIGIPAAAFRSQVGRRIDYAREAVARTDKPGYLVFGPYLSVAKGSYEITVQYKVRMSSAKNDVSSLNYLDVTTSKAKSILGKAVMATEKGEHTSKLWVYLQKSVNDFEVRVWFAGIDDLIVNDVTIARHSNASMR